MPELTEIESARREVRELPTGSYMKKMAIEHLRKLVEEAKRE